MPLALYKINNLLRETIRIIQVFDGKSKYNMNTKFCSVAVIQIQ